MPLDDLKSLERRGGIRTPEGPNGPLRFSRPAVEGDDADEFGAEIDVDEFADLDDADGGSGVAQADADREAGVAEFGLRDPSNKSERPVLCATVARPSMRSEWFQAVEEAGSTAK